MVLGGLTKLDNIGVSTNYCLEKGSNLVPCLFDVLINFRGYPIDIIADIEKEFYQAKIAAKDLGVLLCESEITIQNTCK